MYLPAALHLHPKQLKDALDAALDGDPTRAGEAAVVFGRCCPDMDELCAEKGVRRTPGESCYEMLLGSRHDSLLGETPGTYFLTDYLVEHFQELVVEGLGMDRHLKLKSLFFRNYRRAVHIVGEGESRAGEAAMVALELGLPLRTERAIPGGLESALRATGLGDVEGQGSAGGGRMTEQAVVAR